MGMSPLRQSGAVGCGAFYGPLCRPAVLEKQFTEITMIDENIIHCYSRAQAIADGVLVDVTQTAKEAGYRIPTAVTHAVWCQCVKVPEGVDGQDEAGRLWDILHMLRFAIAREKATSNITIFQLHVRNDNRDGDPPLVNLKAVCGPDDDGRPCITIMLPEED
jgi:hypothetical protein